MNEVGIPRICQDGNGKDRQSREKLHAHGPMALAELFSYKYLIEGDGQIRP